MIRSNGIFSYEVGDKIVSFSNSVPTSWNYLLQYINTNPGVHYNISHVRFKVYGRGFTSDVLEDLSVDTNRTWFFHFYNGTDTEEEVTDEPVIVNTTNYNSNDSLLGKVKVKPGETEDKNILENWEPVINGYINSGESTINPIANNHSFTITTNEDDKYEITGLEIQYKLNNDFDDEFDNDGNFDLSDIKDGDWYIGPKNDNDVIGNLDDVLLDFNDTVGQFSYEVDLNGYEAGVLAERFTKSVDPLDTGELYDFATKNSYDPVAIIFVDNSIDPLNSTLTAITEEDPLFSAIYHVAISGVAESLSTNQAILVDALTADSLDGRISYTSSPFKIPNVADVTVTTGDIQLIRDSDSNIIETEIANSLGVLIVFEGRTHPVKITNISIAETWQSGDKIQWSFSW